MDTTNSFEIPYVDSGDPQRDFPPLNKRAMEIIDAALFEQAGAIQDLDAAIGTTETAITAERAARETAILAEQTARQQANTALTTALAGKVSGTGMTVRVDTTVGTRVLLDHPGGTTMLYGDTGWRDIRTIVENGWESSTLVIKRNADMVYLRGRLDGRNATSDTVFSLPIGWRIAHGRSLTHKTDIGDFLVDAANHVLSTTSRSQYLEFWLFWPATSFPTSLPGTPA